MIRLINWEMSAEKANVSCSDMVVGVGCVENGVDKQVTKFSSNFVCERAVLCSLSTDGEAPRKNLIKQGIIGLLFFAIDSSSLVWVYSASFSSASSSSTNSE